jgi:hypothetical protein
MRLQGEAAEVEVVAAEEHRMPWAAAAISAVATSAVVDISAAALALVAERVSAADPRYRGLQRGQVSAVNARSRFAAIRPEPPAAGLR